MRTFPIKVLGLVVRESSLLGVNVFAIECKLIFAFDARALLMHNYDTLSCIFSRI